EHGLTASVSEILSRIDPLMCDLTDSTTGMGVCVCLKLNVTHDKGKVIAVRTFPVATTEFVKRQDLVFSDPDEDVSGKEINTNTSTTQDSTALDPNEKMPYDITITKCYARFGTFCGSPYINCKPYRRKWGRTSTDCILAICGTSPLNSANLHLVLSLIFYFFDIFQSFEMPQYKLTYFNLAAAAEPIRWAFKVGGVEFEDERLNPADWPKLKKSGRFPGESLPLLEIDGVVYTQSNAILRYLGNTFGLTGENALDNLTLDQVLDVIGDAKQFFRLWMVENNPEKKQEAREVFVNEKVPLCFRQLQAIITAKSGGPFILGSKLTFADLYLATTINNWLGFGHATTAQLTTEYPALGKLKEAVENVPEIKAWLEVRPKTNF
ncbi:unnamed protein product, partial [Allacma fusca]